MISDSVRDITYSPIQETYKAGETLSCTARGHPLPSIVWKIKDSNGVKELAKGNGKAYLEIKDQWVGKDVTLMCTTSNKVNDVVTVLNKTLPTFQALGKYILFILTYILLVLDFVSV